MKARHKAMLEMLICAVMWSIAGLLMKWLPWNALAIASLRSLFAALTVAVYMLVTRTKFVLSKKVLLNAVFLSATFLCFCIANKLTTSANAIVLQFTAPIWIMLFSVLVFHNRFHWYEYLSVLFTLGGIALVFVDGLSLGNLWGLLAGLGAGLAMGAMFLTVGKIDPKEKMSGILLGHSFTFLAGLPAVLITRPELSLSNMTWVIILGVVQLGIPYILLGIASEHCPPLPSCLITAVEPLLNPVWVAIGSGEFPSLTALIGGLVVIAAVTFQCIMDERFIHKRKSAEEASPAQQPVL